MPHVDPIRKAAHRRRRNAKRRQNRQDNPDLARINDRKWHAFRDKNKVYQVSRQWRMRRYYGICKKIFEEMIEQQSGLCAICCAPMHPKNTCIDHNHQNGQVRGLLCQLCNRAIGCLRDSVALTFHASKYLEVHS